MSSKGLAEVVAMKPYPDFATWWPMGSAFMGFMARAIGSQWRALQPAGGDLATIQAEVGDYIQLVYGRSARPTLAADFIEQRNLGDFASGEFDALSYAFFRSAYLTLAVSEPTESALCTARHAFTQRVGRLFYNQLHEHLELTLPTALATADDLAALTAAIDRVGEFLQQQGYLRDHFAFRFDVHLHQANRTIDQAATAVLAQCQANRTVYALYEMGYPAILPSAVYLYHTMGEAQHHSSRTIEELFGRVGYRASETADFDPTGYPSDLVVELWEIVRE